MGVLSVGALGEARHALRHQAAARRPGCRWRPSGSLLFARAPVDGSFVVDVLPSMILLGLGAGIAFNPVLLAAMSDVEPSEAGLASGVVNTVVHDGRRARPRGARQPRRLAHGHLRDGDGRLAALTGGYHVAFLVGALFAVAAAVIGGTLLREAAHAPAHEASCDRRPPRRHD